MSRFWKVRIATFIWGFLVVYFFTGKFDLTSRLFFVQAGGNTFLMWWFLQRKPVHK